MLGVVSKVLIGVTAHQSRWCGFLPYSSLLLAGKWRPIAPPPQHTHTHTLLLKQTENEIHARHYTLPFVSETHFLLRELPKGETLVTFVGLHCAEVANAFCSLMPRLRLLVRNGLVNEIKFLGLFPKVVRTNKIARSVIIT